MNLTYTLAVTGHRPAKISSDLYDVNSELSKRYIKFFKDFITTRLKENGGTVKCLSGMALGVDTMFAIAALQLKNEGYKVKLVSCVPCAGHSSKWQSSSVAIYNAILDKADEVVMVSDKPYTHSCMQDRNIYMVDNCTKLLAVWDGTRGGTGNCVEYAKKVDKQINIIHPKYI